MLEPDVRAIWDGMRARGPEGTGLRRDASRGYMPALGVRARLVGGRGPICARDNMPVEPEVELNQSPVGRQVSSRTLEPDLRWAYELGLDILLPYLKVPSRAVRWR